MPNTKQPKPIFPAQHQTQQPGIESQMNPLPEYDRKTYRGSGKLQDKVAIITGGDSGIGRAVAIAFAKEGAHVVISYLNEDEDAKATQSYIEKLGRTCLLIPGNIGNEAHCQKIIDTTMKELSKIDTLVLNAAEQTPQDTITNITSTQLEKTFRTNLFSMFYLTKAALPHLLSGSNIITTTSVTAYLGNEQLLDYSATKGAITTFTRSLALQLVKQGIRVNGIAPGPIWTPLIPSTFTPDQVSTFGSTTPMGRAGQPVELAPAYVYLASEDSSYVTGQVIHVNGGEVLNG